MLQIQKDASFAKRGLFFGIVEVVFPHPSEWNEDAFAALKEAAKPVESEVPVESAEPVAAEEPEEPKAAEKAEEPEL